MKEFTSEVIKGMVHFRERECNMTSAEDLIKKEEYKR